MGNLYGDDLLRTCNDSIQKQIKSMPNEQILALLFLEVGSDQNRIGFFISLFSCFENDWFGL